MNKDERRRLEAAGARAGMLPRGWLAEQIEWAILVYGSPIAESLWVQDHEQPCPTCGTVLPRKWRHP